MSAPHPLLPVARPNSPINAPVKPTSDLLAQLLFSLLLSSTSNARRSNKKIEKDEQDVCGWTRGAGVRRDSASHKQRHSGPQTREAKEKLLRWIERSAPVAASRAAYPPENPPAMGRRLGPP